MISQTNLKTKTPFTVSLFWKSKQLQHEIIFPRFKTFMLSYFYRRLIFTHLELHQNEPIICVFIVLCKNQSELYLCQGSPELFSPSVMRRREELWGRDWFETGQRSLFWACARVLLDHSKMADNRKESKENQTRWIFRDSMVEDLIEALEASDRIWR